MDHCQYQALMPLTLVAMFDLNLTQYGTSVERWPLFPPKVNRSGTMLLSVQESFSRNMEPNIHDFWLLTNLQIFSSLSDLVTYFSEYQETGEKEIVLSLLEVKDQE